MKIEKTKGASVHYACSAGVGEGKPIHGVIASSSPRQIRRTSLEEKTREEEKEEAPVI